MYIKKYSVTWNCTIKEDDWFTAVNNFQKFQKNMYKKKKNSVHVYTSIRVGNKKSCTMLQLM